MGLTACEPAADGLSTVSVAFTTDRTATHTMERLGFSVSWFSCTATLGDGDGSASPSATPATAEVDCRGETASGQKLTLNGTVTDERSGSCVRGRMTARVDGEFAFEASVLGTCATKTPSATVKTPRPGGARPTVTVTVTETETVRVTPRK
ncbi:hypothetical protein ACWEFL_06600 [Streptomyces sp. NPDC004838]